MLLAESMFPLLLRGNIPIVLSHEIDNWPGIPRGRNKGLVIQNVVPYARKLGSVSQYYQMRLLGIVFRKLMPKPPYS